MDQADLLRKAREAFAADLARPPALTLRGANAVDSYEHAEPFDPDADAPTDEYIEGYAFWAMPYLDARSWRHYLPRLIEYTLTHPDDPAMAAEALVRSVRPPDRVPARLTTLSADQEAVIVELLSRLALDNREDGSTREDARTALEEWWLPGTSLRREASASSAERPTEYRETGGGAYRVTLPTTLEGGGVRDVPSEHRAVEGWSGLVCGDALADVFVNAYSLEHCSWREAEERASRWLGPESRAWIDVPGASKALRLDGTTFRYSPAEPERTTVVITLTRAEVITLTVRGTERADVGAEMERVVRLFRISYEL